MELDHLLTRSDLTYPEVSSKVYHVREEFDKKIWKLLLTKRLICDLHSRYRFCGKVKSFRKRGGGWGGVEMLGCYPHCEVRHI
jgi:hypothetical protein